MCFVKDAFAYPTRVPINTTSLLSITKVFVAQYTTIMSNSLVVSLGVVDPRTEQEISLDEAVARGIIDQSTGTYVNKQTGQRLPIPVAMNAGMIKVTITCSLSQ